MLPVTAFYAALLTALYLFLAYRVIIYRRANGPSVGDAGDPVMLLRMRAHANCAEYAPFGVLLLGMQELQGMPWLWVNILGLLLVTGRYLHGWAFSQTKPQMRARVAGMALTLTMLAISALTLLITALF